MFGPIGMPELVVIFLVALLIFGPRKLPEIGKSIGKGLAEFKRASDDLKKTISDEIEQGKQEVTSLRAELGEVQKTLHVAAPPEPAEPEAPAPPDSRPVHPS